MTTSEIIHVLADVLRNAAFITALVVVMLLLVEYLSAVIGRRKHLIAGKSAIVQTAVGALLGAIPGCVGGFAAVSLYSQGALGTGALLAAFTATMGDEALAMLSIFPSQALLLQAVLLVIALVVGVCVNKYVKNINYVNKLCAFNTCRYHCHAAIHGNLWRSICHISMRRALLAAGLLVCILAVPLGLLEHSHPHSEHFLHYKNSGFFISEGWINVVFALLSCIALVIVMAVEHHFLVEHLWRHVIVRHFCRIFLWALGALLVVAVLEHYTQAQTWLSRNQWMALTAAILIGIIPASGPHFVFVALFASGSISMPILFASMLVQDGHAGLPLLSASKRMFIIVKTIKILLAAILGGICLIY
jgi:hypothetical protein